MRHFGSLLIAMVFAPAIFLLTGTGLSAFTSALDDNKAVDPLGALAAFGALLLGGVLYGILVMARISPLGPGLAGIAALGVSGWAMFDITSYKADFAAVDVHMAGSVGELGLGILLGVPLLATLTSPRRWRKEEYQASASAAARQQPQYQAAPPYRPAPDPTWQLPAQPDYQPLPDIAPPSLRYPAVTPVMVPPSEAPPLPKRVPTPPPAVEADDAAEAPPAEEPTVKIAHGPARETPGSAPEDIPVETTGDDGEEPTKQLG